MLSCLRPALLAGFFGATAGVFTKVAFDQDLIEVGLLRSSDQLGWSHLGLVQDVSVPTLYLLQLFGIACMLFCNICMFKCFNKALQSSATSVEVSLVTTSANLCTTAGYGHVLFHEDLTKGWWFGTLFILSGIFLICSEQEDIKTKSK